VKQEPAEASLMKNAAAAVGILAVRGEEDVKSGGISFLSWRSQISSRSLASQSNSCRRAAAAARLFCFHLVERLRESGA